MQEASWSPSAAFLSRPSSITTTAHPKTLTRSKTEELGEAEGEAGLEPAKQAEQYAGLAPAAGLDPADSTRRLNEQHGRLHFSDIIFQFLADHPIITMGPCRSSCLVA